MDKKQLLQFCKYYKGEKDCPFHNDYKSVLWDYEKVWTERTLLSYEKHEADSNLSAMLDDYVADGLATFAQTDDTPVTLKALLYNRYCHWSQGNADGFKEWYKTRY